MTERYDCTNDVLEHIRKVKHWMDDFASYLQGRAEVHDKSKLESPEKSTYDIYTPKLKTLVFGSDEYKIALAGMGEALVHHYANNRHHPEHFEHGINDMTLYDIVEMLCDWMAAAEAKHEPLNLPYLSKRFGISEQLQQILVNTLQDIDWVNTANGVPVTNFYEPPEE